jgi:antitoxin (DNA-binding transcriptional repressor) of toxin-antitoxin stability system
MERRALHVNESDVCRDLPSILRCVESGVEVIIERSDHPIAVIHSIDPVRRKISECIALLSPDSSATIDPDFANDVEAAITTHREALEPLNWE